MFELWIDKTEPAIRLVAKAGSGLPADLGPRDWALLGPTEPDAAVAAEVESRGYHFFRSDAPPPEAVNRSNADAAGA